MGGEQQALERILHARSAANTHLAALKGRSDLTRQLVRAELRSYVFLRFTLQECDYPHASFEELAEASIAQTAKIAPELVKELDTTKDCMGSTSTMAKKVLLLRSIEKSLVIQLPAMRSAEVVTLDDLGDLVWDTLEGNV